MKRGFVIILLLLAACSPIYPGEAAHQPQQPAYQPPVQQPVAAPQVVSIEAPQPTPTRNRDCVAACKIELNKCRLTNKPPFDTCSHAAQRDLSLCLVNGDDAYCRLAYSKTKGQCFTAYMERCDILYNSCVNKC